MVVCIFFVFLSIGEFILVTAMIRSGQKVLRTHIKILTTDLCFQKESRRVEDMFKVAIPVVFSIFNAVYWPVLMC